ncbi:MAG TPA: site-specific DNA-methyltransferase [Actinomycetota bacterium]|nr:site-specific DNA-methyltransferase [Actinomycetota bacterium]
MEEPRQRRGTATSSFGVGRRESHDSSKFYKRFTLPAISDDDEVVRNADEVLDRVHLGDSRRMEAIASNSVALVVTSPPYFVGKEYEEAVGEGDVPGSYLEYLDLLTDVFAECKRVLEPGGRIAVNVANLGRKPYRSLSADVIGILQDRLGLLLRGEIIWVKGHAASGSCAWGSYGSPVNPVLRDLTERIVVASKGRFDRAKPTRKRGRAKQGPNVNKDDFLDYTTDVWDFPPESARRVNHPAPFPVELPQRLIELYTFRDENEVVLDPFAGSGSTAIAAVRSGRRFVGYELDPRYQERAEKRVAAERARLAALDRQRAEKRAIQRPPPDHFLDTEDFQKRAAEQGRRAKEIAKELLEKSGFDDIHEGHRLRNGVEVNFVAVDKAGHRWMFDVSGAFSSNRPGLKRTDTLWKSLGKAAVIRADESAPPLILLTTNLPEKGSAGYAALLSTRGHLFHDAIEMFSVEGQQRLKRYAAGRNRKNAVGELMTPEE